MENVVTEVVKKGLCCGCGLCAGISHACLRMAFNRSGELVPFVLNCKQCGACLSICPAIGRMETDVFSTYLGEYTNCYIGYSIQGKERDGRAYGGLVTRMLKALLEKKVVTRAVAIDSPGEVGNFSEPRIVTDSKDIDCGIGSKYCRVSYSFIMKDMVKNSETYAIAALPCAIRGFRLLQVKYPSLGKRIKVLIGLTCGHTVNGHYASAILKLTKNKDKETRRDIIADIWSKYFFSSSACLQCKDIFAEYSHISFMDDTGGSSVVIVRDPCMKALLEEEVKSGYAHLLPIDEQNIIDLRAQEIILKKLDGNKKYLFIFNRWLSNVLYSRRKHGKAMGLQILKAYIIILRKIQHNSFLRKLLNGKKA